MLASSALLGIFGPPEIKVSCACENDTRTHPVCWVQRHGDMLPDIANFVPSLHTSTPK